MRTSALSEEQIIEANSIYLSGVPLRLVASQFNISHAALDKLFRDRKLKFLSHSEASKLRGTNNKKGTLKQPDIARHCANCTKCYKGCTFKNKECIGCYGVPGKPYFKAKGGFLVHGNFCGRPEGI